MPHVILLGETYKVGLAPSATEITVRQVLVKLDGDFASTAKAVENGEFALWVGSGISQKAPSLGDLVAAAMEYIRFRAVDPATAAAFMPALDEALEIAGTGRAVVGADVDRSFDEWTLRSDIVDALWNRYSRVLDIRVQGEPSDFVLWEAIDIRRQFAHTVPPAAAHLCIAILVLEGAVHTIASANWDGFIEAAVERLGAGVPGLLQIVVDPDHLRGSPGKATLLKFHGCIVHADEDPASYRKYLTGSYTQIMRWPVNPLFASMRNAVRNAATNRKSLVLGLSIQDMNLQGVFTEAAEVHPWPWPCAPAAPGHVFCEDAIRLGQRDVLRIVYGDAYNDHMNDIHRSSHMRAWGEQVLVALVLKMVADKLIRLMELALAADGKAALAANFTSSLNDLRDIMADGATVDAADRSRTSAVDHGIAIWSRLLSVFRAGILQRDPTAYEAISSSGPDILAADPNAQSNNLGRLAIMLALLEYGRAAGFWSLAASAGSELPAGVAAMQLARASAAVRPLFLVKSASEAIRLEADCAYANDNAVVIHADDIWHRTRAARSSRRPSGAPGRTGSVEPTHVSLGDLLQRIADVDGLRDAFVAEVML